MARSPRDAAGIVQQKHVPRSIGRVLPTQPKPAAGNFAPAPVDRSQRTATIWIDRRPVWTGPADQVDTVVDEILFDRIGPPELPPVEPIRPIDETEICVGTVMRAADSDHLDEDSMEIDCDLAPAR